MSIRDERRKRIIQLLQELRKELMRPASEPIGKPYHIDMIAAIIEELEEEMDVGTILPVKKRR